MNRVLSLSAADLAVTTEEILLSLGCPLHAQEADMHKKASAAISRARMLAAPSAVDSTFALTWADGHPIPVGAALPLPGDDIAAHLCGCDKVLLLAVTLGHAVERELHRLSADPTAALYFDAACSLLTEAAADAAQAEMLSDISNTLRFRYSPGYGDLPLSVQPALLSVLDASRHIGLTLTDSDLLLPRKSITGIVGILT